MCYMVYLSTTDDKDLSVYNSPLIGFTKIEPDDTKTVEDISLLQYPNKWYVGSYAGPDIQPIDNCSCNFRHYFSKNGLGFAPPGTDDQYNFKEKLINIEATKIFYGAVCEILKANNEVDCISLWAGSKSKDMTSLDVDLNEVTEDTFRFFENYHFRFYRSKVD